MNANRIERRASTFILIVLGLLLASCEGEKNSASTAYIPPPPISEPPAATQPVAIYTSPPAPQCTNDLRFLQDLTIPDDSSVAPGSELDKQWLVENNGTCNWDHAYRLRLIAGPGLAAPAEQALYPARSGTQAIIRILFTAPAIAGTYRSAWQAYDPQGNNFGDPIFIEIIVFP